MAVVVMVAALLLLVVVVVLVLTWWWWCCCGGAVVAGCWLWVGSSCVLSHISFSSPAGLAAALLLFLRLLLQTLLLLRRSSSACTTPNRHTSTRWLRRALSRACGTCAPTDCLNTTPHHGWATCVRGRSHLSAVMQVMHAKAKGWCLKPEVAITPLHCQFSCGRTLLGLPTVQLRARDRSWPTSSTSEREGCPATSAYSRTSSTMPPTSQGSALVRLLQPPAPPAASVPSFIRPGRPQFSCGRGIEGFQRAFRLPRRSAPHPFFPAARRYDIHHRPLRRAPGAGRDLPGCWGGQAGAEGCVGGGYHRAWQAAEREQSWVGSRLRGKSRGDGERCGRR